MKAVGWYALWTFLAIAETVKYGNSLGPGDTGREILLGLMWLGVVLGPVVAFLMLMGAILDYSDRR